MNTTSVESINKEELDELLDQTSELPIVEMDLNQFKILMIKVCLFSKREIDQNERDMRLID